MIDLPALIDQKISNILRLHLANFYYRISIQLAVSHTGFFDLRRKNSMPPG